MKTLEKGRWRARLAATEADLHAAQRLRWRCFIAAHAERGGDCGLDADAMDPLCRHVLIEDRATAQLAGCFRFMDLPGGAAIGSSYSAQFYDLTALSAYPGPMIEIGRFCTDPATADPDILRIAWAALAEHVDETGAQLLFGCSSFLGTEVAPYADAFALLRESHIAPPRWLPRTKAPEVVPFAQVKRCTDARRAMAAMPGLLRTYLSMGGWVSDHAVMDRHLNTLHVFTGLEVASVPPHRARAVRALAG